MSTCEPVKVRTSLKLSDSAQERAKNGDESVLPEIRKGLKEAPEAVRELGDVSLMAIDALLDRVSWGNLVVREAGSLRVAQLRNELLGLAPSPLERLLVERILVCWLHLHNADVQRAIMRGGTFTEGDYYERCIDRAQRRYLEAIKALGQVRRLELPSMQVNLATGGGKQVNVFAPKVGE